MKIRSAGKEDLSTVAGVWLRTASDLFRRYLPDVPYAPPPAAERERAFGYLLDSGAMFVAEEGDEPAGFAAAIVRDGVWFLSQLWVLPEHQQRGIGARLLDRAMVWGEGSRAFSTLSSPFPGAQSLYLRRGMLPVWTQMELAGERPEDITMPDGCEPLTDDDQPWIDALERDVRGIVRPGDHAHWRSIGRGVALRRDGKPVGFVYVNGSRAGPGVVADPGDTPTLVRAALAMAEREISFPVPSTNRAALRELATRGFRWIYSNAYLSSIPMPDGSRYLSSGGRLG